MKHIIFWENQATNSYFYGSLIQFHSDKSVTFKNELMPSGSAINEWFSQTTYTESLTLVGLPLLKKGKSYQLELEATIVPEQGVYIGIILYDRFDKVIDQVIGKTRHVDFTYPLDAYRYTIQLMNAGHKALHFHKMLLSEVEITN